MSLASPSLDTLQRRHRDRPVSSGKRVTLQERDWLWLQKIHQHGPLSSSELHAFSGHLCISPKRARDRLTDLFNEERTPHSGAYLMRPPQQFARLDARYHELVHDLAPAGEHALREAGLWHDTAGGASGPWKHRRLVAAITAAIELETIRRGDVGFIPQHAILDRAQTTLRHPVPFENPVTGKIETRDLIPDALFGLEYHTPDGLRFRFFVVEADRGTEPARASSFNRKSHQRTFLQYMQYVGRGLYKPHLNLTSGLLVLHVTTRAATFDGMLRLMDSIAPRGCNYQLFRMIPEEGAPALDGGEGSGWAQAPWLRNATQKHFEIFTP